MDASPEFQEQFKRIRDLPDGRLMAALIDFLAGEDAVRHSVAIEVLTRTGAAAIPHLIQEAFQPGRDSSQTVRILTAIELMDEPLQRDDRFTLVAQLANSDKAVKAKLKILLQTSRAAPTDLRRVAQQVTAACARFDERLNRADVSEPVRPASRHLGE